MSTPGDRSGNQSIARASRLLRCFVDSPDGLTLAELSKRTDLHPSTAHRMMTALVEGGLIAKGDRDRYRPGIALLALGASATVAVGIDAAVPFLENLAEETGESANLAVKDIDCAVVIAEIESRQRLISRLGSGSRLSLLDSAHGQILLACSADPAADISALPRPIVRGGEYTDAGALVQEIDEVRRRGYSLVSDGEMAALAVPVPSLHGPGITRSLGITAPSRRLTGQAIDRAVSVATDVAGLLRGVSTPLTERIGGRSGHH
jgi:IclR family transcriptional regulator, acetate operon repressor